MRIRYEHALRFDAFSRFIETITQQRFKMASNLAYYVISIHIILSGIISHEHVQGASRVKMLLLGWNKFDIEKKVISILNN